MREIWMPVIGYEDIYEVSKAVYQFDTQGNFIKEYPSAIQAERETGIRNARISECCLGKRPRGGGYIWRHAK